MAKRFLMGNEAIGLAALHAGVGFISGYPGTPSTEVLETAAKYGSEAVHVEWSVNEKTALEAAAGASLAGLRSMVTMKQVGLNVASDPVMSLSYIGVKGGLVLLVADDPGPISSQTEQDTRLFARFAKIPVFDPSSPEEAYEMVFDAFELSEKNGCPVILRPTTRICHACADIEVREQAAELVRVGKFEKDPKWVIFPRLSYNNHLKLEARDKALSQELCSYRFNTVCGDKSADKGIVCSGVSYVYVMEALSLLGLDCPVLKISTPYPFPERLAADYMTDKEAVLCVEELEAVVEKELGFIKSKYNTKASIVGRLTGACPLAGENTVTNLATIIAGFLGVEYTAPVAPVTPALPVRPPVLCAGCPHRASFYAVKQALKGKKAVFSGDIGCYTLGNAAPLDCVDTCLCMGAGITMAQGLHTAEPDAVNVAFVGDSTFFHTGIPGVINAVYNKHKITVAVLDNSSTAMTGHQPHPGLGFNARRETAQVIDIEALLRASGVGFIKKCNPLCLEEAVSAVKQATQYDGVSAIIFKSPCAAVVKHEKPLTVSEACTGCLRCIKELGCPALCVADGKAYIDSTLCTGCGLCTQVCKFGAIASNCDCENGGDVK